MARLLRGQIVVLLVRPNDFFIFDNFGKVRRIVFPSSVIKNQEVVDKKMFEKILRDFFGSVPKQESVIFLSHELVFDRQMKAEAQRNMEEELKKFLEVVPLAVTHAATKTIRTPKMDYFFAANTDIYGTIAGIAKQYGWQIKYAVPLVLFDGLLGGRQVSYAFFLQALRNKELLERSNFLEVEEKEEEVKEDKIPTGQYLMMGLALVIFAGAVLYAAYTFHFFPFAATPQPKTKVVISPTKKPVASITPTAAITKEEEIKKEDIRIQILNGSGVDGQASKLKDQLEALGFAGVETGNAEGPTSNATIVIFSKRVPQELQDEILIELKNTFTSVDTQKLSTDEGFDVSITTGEVK